MRGDVAPAAGPRVPPQPVPSRRSASRGRSSVASKPPSTLSSRSSSRSRPVRSSTDQSPRMNESLPPMLPPSTRLFQKRAFRTRTTKGVGASSEVLPNSREPCSSSMRSAPCSRRASPRRTTFRDRASSSRGLLLAREARASGARGTELRAARAGAPASGSPRRRAREPASGSRTRGAGWRGRARGARA